MSSNQRTHPLDAGCTSAIYGYYDIRLSPAVNRSANKGKVPTSASVRLSTSNGSQYRRTVTRSGQSMSVRVGNRHVERLNSGFTVAVFLGRLIISGSCPIQVSGPNDTRVTWAESTKGVLPGIRGKPGLWWPGKSIWIAVDRVCVRFGVLPGRQAAPTALVNSNI